MAISDEAYNVKIIIRWITEIKRMKGFVDNVQFDGRKGNSNIVKRKYIFKHKCPWEHEIEIDETMMLCFCEFMKKEIEHYEKLIEESDPTLVEIAEEYIKGNLSDLVSR